MKTADCSHASQINPDVQPTSSTCQECVQAGTHPVALRMCLVCGNVGCCDSSVGRHATGHFKSTGHAVMESVEPGGPDNTKWRWCYQDNDYLE